MNKNKNKKTKHGSFFSYSHVLCCPHTAHSFIVHCQKGQLPIKISDHKNQSTLAL